MINSIKHSTRFFPLILNHISLLFGMEKPVSRKQYILWGFGLTGLKYAGECLSYFLVSGHFLTPLNFLEPFASTRYPEAKGLWFTSAMIIWSLPFVWIGFSMSFRRALNAGLTPYLSFLFFIPDLNYIIILVLSVFLKKKPPLTETKVLDPKPKSTFKKKLSAFLYKFLIFVVGIFLMCVILIFTLPFFGLAQGPIIIYPLILLDSINVIDVSMIHPALKYIGGICLLIFVFFTYLWCMPLSYINIKNIIKNIKLFKPIFIGFIVLMFSLIGVLVAFAHVNIFKQYMTSTFLLLPFVGGFIEAFLLKSKTDMNHKQIYTSIIISVILLHLSLFTFALEGAFCLLLSFFFILPFFIAGAFFGINAKRIYGKKPHLGFYLLVFLFPLVESLYKEPYKGMVENSIEIKALPEEIWPYVVQCPKDLPPVKEWVFKVGAAYPIRSSTKGEGVGAVRHCEFSTGKLVQNVTTWDQPYHLAFSVQKQIDIMKEISFYDHVHAPHILKGYFRAVKGDFQLLTLKNGNTLLKRRTWYEMDIHPAWYWGIYSDWLIKKVQNRVLKHIKKSSEKPNPLDL